MFALPTFVQERPEKGWKGNFSKLRVIQEVSDDRIGVEGSRQQYRCSCEPIDGELLDFDSGGSALAGFSRGSNLQGRVDDCTPAALTGDVRQSTCAISGGDLVCPPVPEIPRRKIKIHATLSCNSETFRAPIIGMTGAAR